MFAVLVPDVGWLFDVPADEALVYREEGFRVIPM